MPIGKPGTGIFLMKQKAKLYKEYAHRKVFKLNKKLGP